MSLILLADKQIDVVAAYDNIFRQLAMYAPGATKCQFHTPEGGKVGKYIVLTSIQCDMAAR